MNTEKTFCAVDHLCACGYIKFCYYLFCFLAEEGCQVRTTIVKIVYEIMKVLFSFVLHSPSLLIYTQTHILINPPIALLKLKLSL
jgi:hypothetical protein